MSTNTTTEKLVIKLAEQAEEIFNLKTQNKILESTIYRLYTDLAEQKERLDNEHLTKQVNEAQIERLTEENITFAAQLDEQKAANKFYHSVDNVHSSSSSVRMFGGIKSNKPESPVTETKSPVIENSYNNN